MPTYDIQDPKSQEQKNRPPLLKSTMVDPPEMSIISQTSSLKSRNFSRQVSLSFNFPHVDSMVFSTCLERAESLENTEVPWWTSHRLRLAILCFLGFISVYAQRVNLSIAIVSMVSQHKPTLTFNLSRASNISTTLDPLSDSEDKCPALSADASQKESEFQWSKELEGLILGAFFWGYLVFQVPGGRLSEMFGAKRVIAVTMFPVAILSILSPIVARTNPYLFLVLRVIVGLCEGVVYPAVQALWTKWAPPHERSRLIGFSFAGGQFGNAIIFPIGGFLCAYGFDGGWPSVFYLVGAVGFIWCMFWVMFAFDSPDQDPTISIEERNYIVCSLGNKPKSSAIQSLPWRAILTSSAVWAIIGAHMCGNYGAYMLLTKLPAYMKEVLKFDIKANGMFSMLPYLAFWFVITISGLLADCLISREILSVACTRKVMSTIGLVGPAAFLVGTSFMECDQQVGAVIMLTIAVGLCGFHFSGYFINHGDIAPPFAGTLFGLSNMLATVPGIFSPYVVSAMTKNGTREEWQATFYVAAGIYVAGAVWYIILGQGEVQSWAKQIDNEETKADFDESDKCLDPVKTPRILTKEVKSNNI